MSFPALDENFDRHDGSLANWYRGFASYGLEVLYDQPLGFWRLNESTGTTALGLMSNNVDGTYTGGFTLATTGPLTDGLTGTLLNGSTGFVSLTTSIAYLQPATAFTIEAWFKTSVNNRVIFGGDARGITLKLDASNKLVGTFHNGTALQTITSTTSVADNVYHHGVVTYDGAHLNLYLDGASNATAVVATGSVSYTGQTALSIGGAGGATTPFSGQLADVAFYDTALSAARATIHHNVGIGTATTTTLTPAISDKHYDLRVPTNTNPTVPYSQNDLAYWNVPFFTGTTAGTMTTGTVITTFNENWAGTGITLSRNSSWRYQPFLSVTGTTASFDSSITDDIMTDFNDGATYFIEGQLRGFPAQAAGAHFDLTNSFIDISSDASYAVGSTDTFTLASSITSLAAGGDIAFRYNLTSLTHSNKNTIKHVRFRLATTGGSCTFQLESIRLYPSTKVFNTIDVGTRGNVLKRTLPQNGVEWTKDFMPMYRRGTPLKNYTYWVKFNSGHAPVRSLGSNKLSFLARYNEASGQYIQILLIHNQSESRLKINENGTEIMATTANTNTLTDSTDYYLKVELNGGKTRASIYGGSGLFPSTLIYTTDWQTVQSQDAGYVGLWFQPYNYDFTVSFMRSSLAQIGNLESSIFATQTPVRAVTLNPKSSLNTDLMVGQTLSVIGDAVLSSSTTIGNPVPSMRLQRTGTQWFAGLQTTSPLVIGNPTTLQIEGDLFVTTEVRGQYRAVLKDKNGIVAYIGQVFNLTADKWSHFSLLVNGQFVPGSYFLSIEQAGFFNDVFYIDNLQALQPTFVWEGSADGGTTWYPFNTAIGTKYSNLNFPLPGTQLKLRGSALDTDAWVAGYEIIPVYGYPGQLG